MRHISPAPSVARRRLSKFGNARLRRSFWLAAQVAIRQRDNSFREHYGRYIAKDPENKHLRRKALTAVAAKMARVAHAIVCSGADYRPFYRTAGAKWKDFALLVAVRARVTPLPCRQCWGLSLGRVSRFKDGQDRRRFDGSSVCYG